MWIICQADYSHEKSSLIFSEKKNRNAYLEMLSATVVIFGLKVNQTNWPLVIKHINWVDNHQMIITTKYSSHHFTDYGAMQFNHFLIISLWELSVAKVTKPP